MYVKKKLDEIANSLTNVLILFSYFVFKVR